VSTIVIVGRRRRTIGIGTGTLIDFWEIHEMAGTVMSIEGQKIQRSLMT
jgi:hypothetical protein